MEVYEILTAKFVADGGGVMAQRAFEYLPWSDLQYLRSKPKDRIAPEFPYL
jgi:hypothetical protein